ncbi:MAG: SMP-30/gluconolactonase/LRE family protein [Caulobacteraceae bacterium]|nr:SMP-30/gluconolactonase/LRE family protein [Caulobacteraceae bacterium]
MITGEVIADGLGVAEGPCWCADGSVVVTSVDQGVLYRISPQGGEAAVLARTRGGPNGAAPAADGGFIVTQNGGFDFNQVGLKTPPPDLVEPGLQRVAPDGSVSYLLQGGFQSPNDLVVAPDGTLYFTDPPRFPFEPEARGGRVWSLAAGAREAQVVAAGFVFCNGIGVAPDGGILPTEHGGIVRLSGADERPWVIRHAADVDGFCLDAEGRIYASIPSERGVRVFEDGRSVDFLPLPGADRLGPGEIMWCTNCCFGGEDMRTLFATTGFPGRLVAFTGMPTAGAPVRPWPA